ncbi:hypothetical protein H6503_00515 [Candidatus Woesearchaeota archaeon]|nr:hypothetical protein [Candidatus Woesearchaeota archaeon]
MADLIAGLSLVQGLERLMPALLVLILLYGILEYTKALGKNPFVNVFIALIAAALVLISDKATQMLAFMTPWFVILFFFIIFMLIAFKSMGVSDSSILGAMKNNRGIVWTIIFIGIIIAAVGLGNVIGQELLNKQPGVQKYVQNSDGTFTSPEGTIVTTLPEGATSSSSYQDNLTLTLFHPKVLGFLLIALIAAYTVQFMTKAQYR